MYTNILVCMSLYYFLIFYFTCINYFILVFFINYIFLRKKVVNNYKTHGYIRLLEFLLMFVFGGIVFNFN